MGALDGARRHAAGVPYRRGEKDFEEFFTEKETLDMERFSNLGIIKNEPLFDPALLTHFEETIDCWPRVSCRKQCPHTNEYYGLPQIPSMLFLLFLIVCCKNHPHGDITSKNESVTHARGSFRPSFVPDRDATRD
jgi:hypothetical protein